MNDKEKQLLFKFLKEEKIYNILRILNLNLKKFNPISVLYRIREYKTPNSDNMEIYIKYEEFVLKKVLKKTKKELLDDFLKEHRAKTRYYNNLKKDKKNGNYKNTIGLKGTFLFAFNWKQTKEGYNYWSNISDEFYNYIEDKIIRIYETSTT